MKSKSNWLDEIWEEAMRQRRDREIRQERLAKLKERNVGKISWEELECLDHRKSFYGKAHYGFLNGAILLKSYNTIVCAISPDKTKVIRIWNDETMTTTRHFNSFMKKFGIDKSGIKDWRELPVDTYYLERINKTLERNEKAECLEGIA